MTDGTTQILLEKYNPSDERLKTLSSAAQAQEVSKAVQTPEELIDAARERLKAAQEMDAAYLRAMAILEAVRKANLKKESE